MNNKRTLNKQDWVNRLQEWQESGLSALKWSRENNIEYKTLIYWKNKLLEPDFIEISSKEDLLELRIGNVSLLLTENFKGKTLIRCLEVIKKC